MWTDAEQGSTITSITWVSGASDSQDAAFLPAIKDAINFGSYIRIQTSDGEKPLSAFHPTVTLERGTGDAAAKKADAEKYIEVSADGYIIGKKDTAGTPAKVTLTFPTSVETPGSEGAANVPYIRTLEVHVVTDARPAQG